MSGVLRPKHGELHLKEVQRNLNSGDTHGTEASVLNGGCVEVC